MFSLLIPSLLSGLLATAFLLPSQSADSGAPAIEFGNGAQDDPQQSKAQPQSKIEAPDFSGLWKTTYGRMRLEKIGEGYVGTYSYGAVSNMTGKVLPSGKLEFQYSEPEASGEGLFTLNEDGKSFRGKWRATGTDGWQAWTGQRLMPKANRKWLVVLEAHWESGLDESEYAFGDMLRSYFTMASARHISVRHRYFHDEGDLRRFCREVAFLAEPVTLLISTHGSKKGLSVAGKTVTAEAFAKSLLHAHNVKLLHLSGCDMMAGNMPQKIHNQLAGGAMFPISGYKTSVAWDASALGDFTFLSLVLMHGMTPSRAAEQAILLSPYLGDKKIDGAVFVPLGLAVVPAPAAEHSSQPSPQTAKPSPASAHR